MRRMTRLVFSLLFGVMGWGLSGHLCWGEPTTFVQKVLHTLPVTDLTGNAMDIGAQKGWKVVYFWSEHCPCVRDCEQLSLIPLARKYAGRVTFYAVAANQDDVAEAKTDRASFESNVGTHGLPYSVVLDPKDAVADVLGAVATPQTFLIDPTGRVLFKGSPDDSWTIKNHTGRAGVTQAYLADALTEALAGKTVTHPHVKSLGCSILRQ